MSFKNAYLVTPDKHGIRKNKHSIHIISNKHINLILAIEIPKGFAVQLASFQESLVHFPHEATRIVGDF